MVFSRAALAVSRLLAAAFLFCSLAAAGQEGKAPLASFGLPSSKELDSMGYYHRIGEGTVLQMQDPSQILDANSLSAKAVLWATNKTASPRKVEARLRLLTSAGLELARFDDGPLTLPCGVTVQREYPFSLKKEAIPAIEKAASSFALGFVRVEAEVFDSAGEPLGMVVPDASFGYRVAGREALPPQARIVQRDGVPTLSLNGIQRPGNFGLVGWNWGACRRSVLDMAPLGRHVYKIAFQPWGLWREGKLDQTAFSRKLDEMVLSIAGRDPEAMIILLCVMYAPKDYASFHPGELAVFDDGSSKLELFGQDWPQPSVASDLWFSQCAAFMKAAIRDIQNGPYADRVFAFEIGCGNAGEWNGFGYKNGKFEDFSPRMRAKFVESLKRSYGSLDLLSKAWGEPLRSWDDVEVPSRKERLAGEGAINASSCARKLRDYYAFYNRLVAERVRAFSKAAKDASNGSLLSGAYYGYFAHHLRSGPTHMLDSGHFALAEVLASRDVDYIVQPQSSTHSHWTRNLLLGAPMASVALHGKLFVVEDEPATYLAALKGGEVIDSHKVDGPGARDARDTVVWYWRDYARQLTCGASAYWLEFNKGWFEFPEFIDLARRVEAVNKVAASSPMGSVAETAVFIDEDSVFDLSLSSNVYGKALFETWANAFDEAGVPVDVYLSSDLEPALKKGYKLLVFLNQLRRSEKVAKALESYEGSILWMYGSGSVDGSSRLDSSSWTGLRVACRPDAAAFSVKIPGVGELSLPEPLRPAFSVEDPNAEPLGTDGSGSVVFASKPRPGGAAYYYGLPLASSETLRFVCSRAGVFSYCQAKVPVYANESFIGVFLKDGTAPVRLLLPRKAKYVVDMWDGSIAGRDASFIDVDPRGAPASKLFLYGDALPGFLTKEP